MFHNILRTCENRPKSCNETRRNSKRGSRDLFMKFWTIFSLSAKVFHIQIHKVCVYLSISPWCKYDNKLMIQPTVFHKV